MTLFFKEQVINHKHGDARQRRWHESIISFCLTMWCRSPRAYRDLRSSGFLILPCERTLSKYKNSVKQREGVTDEMLSWLTSEADRRGIPDDQRRGGLYFDEMAIQPDLILRGRGDDSGFCGLVNTGEEGRYIRDIINGERKQVLATEVLQVVWVGHNGFRFPFAHYPTKHANPAELTSIFLDCVLKLRLKGFIVDFVSLDGSSQNRQFTKSAMGGIDPREADFMMTNPVCSNKKIAFIQCFMHVIKKIRNGLLKSGTTQFSKKRLTCKGKLIAWNHWLQAYKYDLDNNFFRLHYHLTTAHFHPTRTERMRNHLALEVLNERMLALMKAYQSSLPEHSQQDLSSTIDLLEATSILVKNFSRTDHISSLADPIFESNMRALSFFNCWETDIMSDKKDKQKAKKLLSSECRCDLNSSIVGFAKLCDQILKCKGQSVVPKFINNDVVENIFSQQRSLHNGSSTNPNYHQYSYSMNSVLIGRCTIVKNNNSSQTARSLGCQVPKLKKIRI